MARESIGGGAPAQQAPARLLTPRLELRLFAPADHEPYARICADPQVMRYVGAGQPNTPEITWRSMAAMLGHWALKGHGIWAVQLRDGPLIGHAGFIDVPGWPGFELAWLLGREHWGHGYAREAATAAREVAFGTLRRERVISLIRPQNEPSIRLAKALGAQQEGEVELMGSAAQVYVHQRPSAVR
jgi:RimJ/RimL family protein N-acetyltransferase